MHAVVMHEFGAAEVLRPGEFSAPADRQGWVTVALRASALNWHDVLVRQGRYRSPLPHIIGADGAGVRTDTREQVVVLPSLNWGQSDEAPSRHWEILGDHTPGTYAELVSVPAGFAEAGTVPIRLDWSGLAIDDAVAAGDVIGHWIWQTGKTEIRAPAGCAGTVLDLRAPECDILDQPPSQVLLVLAP